MDLQGDIFKTHGDSHVRLYFYECEHSISLEDLYQQFKARMLREMTEAKEE